MFNIKGIKKNPLNLESCYGINSSIRNFYPKKARGRFDNTLLICHKDKRLKNLKENFVQENSFGRFSWKVKTKIINLLKN